MKRLKKILKWTAIVAGAAIVLVLILNALFVWRTGARLEARLAALRQAGEPVRIADLARPPVPPEKDAGEFLRRAAGDLEAIQKDLDALFPRMGYPKGKPAPAEQEKLEKTFAAHPQVMPLLEQAASCPDCDPKLETNLPRKAFLEACMDLAARHRPLYRVLRARSTLLMARGRADDAVAAQLVALRLARLWHRDPMLIGYLVTAVSEYSAMEVINQVLQAGPVSPETRRAIDAELARHDTMDGYAWALRTERAFSLETVGDLPFAGNWLTGGFANDLRLRLLDLYDRRLADTSRPFLRVADERKAAPPARRGWNPYAGLMTLLEPATFSGLEAANRVRAMERSLRVLNALQARPGSDPVPALTDLGLPAEATTDPFNGEPLRVKKSPRGWMVYSVGANGEDDGGQLEGATDVGVGPIGPEEPPKKP